MTSVPDSPIEDYLDELTRLLATGRPRDLRYLVAETEAHLRDDVEAAVAAGTPVAVAEAQAVARLGPAHLVARAELDRQRPSWSELAQRTVVSAIVLGAVGCIAVGVSGAIAAVIRVVSSASSLVHPDGAALTAANCARWLANNPGAGTCRAAATSDWAAEVVYYRIALGLFGLIVLGALALVRRRAPKVVGGGLPRIVGDAIATTLFVVAAGWTLALGVDALVQNGAGWGQWLSAAPVALAFAGVFVARTVRDLRAGAVPGVSLSG